MIVTPSCAMIPCTEIPCYCQVDYFKENPGIFMYGVMCVVYTTGVWLPGVHYALHHGRYRRSGHHLRRCRLRHVVRGGRRIPLPEGCVLYRGPVGSISYLLRYYCRGAFLQYTFRRAPCRDLQQEGHHLLPFHFDGDGRCEWLDLLH